MNVGWNNQQEDVFYDTILNWSFQSVILPLEIEMTKYKHNTPYQIFQLCLCLYASLPAITRTRDIMCTCWPAVHSSVLAFLYLIICLIKFSLIYIVTLRMGISSANAIRSSLGILQSVFASCCWCPPEPHAPSNPVTEGITNGHALKWISSLPKWTLSWTFEA